MAKSTQAPGPEESKKRKRERQSEDDELKHRSKDLKLESALERKSGVDNEQRPAKARKQNDLDESIAKRDPVLLSDTFAQAIARHKGRDSTAVELSDLAIPSRAFFDTSTFDKPHIATNLPSFLERYVEGGREELSSCRRKNCPHTLVVTCSGIRVADLYRELLHFNREGTKVSKFIAKHMKLKDNIHYLGQTKVGIAIATPQRLADLIEQDALKLEDVKRIVVDASYRDDKKRTILTMDDVFGPLLRLLNTPALKSRYGSDADDAIALIVF